MATNKCVAFMLDNNLTNMQLPKLGELPVYYEKGSKPSLETRGLTVNALTLPSASRWVGVYVPGKGSGTDGYDWETKESTFTGTLEIARGETKDLVVSNHSGVVMLGTKYGLGVISRKNTTGNGDMYLNISDLHMNTNMHTLVMPNTKTFGSINDLKKLTAMSTLDLGGTKVTGSLSALENMSSLKKLDVNGTGVDGDLASLAKATGLTYLDVSNTGVTGDFDEVTNALKKLKTLNCAHTAVKGNPYNAVNPQIIEELNLDYSKVTLNVAELEEFTGMPVMPYLNGLYAEGDMSQAHANLRYVSMKDNVGTLSWSTTRINTAKIISIVGYPNFGSDLGAMVKNQAQCVAGFENTVANKIYLKIEAKGKLSTVDEADVTALKEKGYTVDLVEA